MIFFVNRSVVRQLICGQWCRTLDDKEYDFSTSPRLFYPPGQAITFKIDSIKILFMKKFIKEWRQLFEVNLKVFFKSSIKITWFHFSITVTDLYNINYFKLQLLIRRDAISFGQIKRRQITSKTINRIFCWAKNGLMERSIMWRKIIINREHKEKLNGPSFVLSLAPRGRLVFFLIVSFILQHTESSALMVQRKPISVDTL